MLCDFDVRLQFRGDGLLGGIHEYDPYFTVHGTFGEYKKAAKMPLMEYGREKRANNYRKRQHKRKAVNGEKPEEKVYEFDAEIITYRSLEAKNFKLVHSAQETRADEMLWFELWCETRNFGMDELDERQSQYTSTNNTCGQVQIDLLELFAAHARTGKSIIATLPVVDDKIIGIKAMEYHQQATAMESRRPNFNQLAEMAARETSKGTLQLEFRFNHFNHQMYAETVFAVPNLKSEHLYALGADRRGDKEQQKSMMLSPTNGRKQKSKGVSSLALGSNAEQSSEFSPLMYTSQKGIERMMHSLENHVLRPYCANFLKLSEVDAEPRYAPLNENVKNLQLPMWISKMGRLPDACYWGSMDPTLREYASESLRQQDLKLYGFNEKTEKLLLHLLHSSLRRHGISADRFEREIHHHFSVKNKSTKTSAGFLVSEAVIADLGTFAANLGKYTSDYRFVTRSERDGKTQTSRMVGLDSWDWTLLLDEGKGDDCEGLDITSSTVIRTYGIGRADKNFRWESKSLSAVQLFLAHTMILDVGGTVTSEYVDTNNEKVKLDKAEDLPMVGDAADLRSRSDGHCWAIMLPLTRTLTLLQAGNVGEDVLSRVKAAVPASDEFRARDSQRIPLVLEPTSSIEPNILPLQEAYGAWPELCTKRHAERLFFKHAIRAALEERKSDGDGENLADMFQGEDFQYYVKPQDPRRRISSFYNELVHGTSIDLWKRFHISLGQFAFCTQVRKGELVYGVKIAEFLRSPQHFALVCPFYECREEWTRSVIPYVEAVQHQLPLMSFGRYTDEKYATLHSSYNTPAELGEKYQFAPTESSPAQQRFEKLAAAVVDNPNHSIVRLYSRPWKFQQSEKKTREFVEFMADRPGVIAHAYYTEKQLPVCQELIEIMFIIDVKECLKMEQQ
jgi:hypothetical protein